MKRSFDPTLAAFLPKVFTGFLTLSLKFRPVVHGGGHPQILADQLTLSQQGGADYTHHIITGTPGFSDLPTALSS